MDFLKKIKFWLTTRRECVWCERRHWIGGNPFARQITGGMCARGAGKFLEPHDLSQPASPLSAAEKTPRLQKTSRAHTLSLMAMSALLISLTVLIHGQRMAGAPGRQRAQLPRRATFTVCSPSAETSSSAVTSQRLAALSQIESGDSDMLIGRAAEVSRYQITPRVWREYCKLDPVLGGRNPFTAFNVAEAILRDRCNAFEKRFHRAPSDFEFYVLWNRPACLISDFRFPISDLERARARQFSNLVSQFNKQNP